MTDRDALFAAICADPEDDTARLAFADWLDEHGDGKHAAYIRAAVEEWRRENADSPAAAVYHFLNDLKEYTGGQAFLDPVDWSPLDAELGAIHAFAKARKSLRLARRVVARNLPKIRGVIFDREDVGGFYNEVIVTNPDTFLANADAVFRAAPIYYLYFTSRLFTAAHAREFVAAGHLARVRWFLFDFIEPEALRILGDHRDAGGVTSIELACTEQAAEQIEQLLAGSRWTALSQLFISGLHGTDGVDPNELAARIVRGRGFQRLQELCLMSSHLGDAAARAIATAGLTELRMLDLNSNGIGTEGAAALAESKLLPKLRYLDFHRNPLCGAEGTSRLIASPKLSNLTALRLWASGHDSGGLDPATLAKPSRGPTLRALELECGPLSAWGLAALAKCPAAHGLWFLSIRASAVSDSGLRALTKSKGFRELTVLDLENNTLTPNGVESLAKWRTSLQALNLAGNEVGAAGAKAIIRGEHLQGLKRLLVTDRGSPQLRSHFGKRVVPE